MTTDTKATNTADQTDDDFDDESNTKPAEKTFSQADLDRIVADRVARTKAQFADYGDLKKKAAAAMSENERAVAEAEQRGRSAALTSVGTRLAAAELKAAAAGKVSPAALEGFLEFADLSRFVTDDGDVDTKAVALAVKKLGGTPGASATNYDGGARGSADKPQDMNFLIRRAAGLG